jgi:hypothetical protein
MKLLSPLFRVLAFSLALLPAVPAVAADAPKKVLVVTVTTGFRHSSIPVAEKILEQLAKESGKFTVEFVRQPEGMPKPLSAPRPGKAGADDPAHKDALKKHAEEAKAYDAKWTPQVVEALKKLSPASLKNYDAVLFASTTGDDFPLPGLGGVGQGVHRHSCGDGHVQDVSWLREHDRRSVQDAWAAGDGRVFEPGSGARGVQAAAGEVDGVRRDLSAEGFFARERARSRDAR